MMTCRVVVKDRDTDIPIGNIYDVITSASSAAAWLEVESSRVLKEYTSSQAAIHVKYLMYHNVSSMHHGHEVVSRN